MTAIPAFAVGQERPRRRAAARRRFSAARARLPDRALDSGRHPRSSRGGSPGLWGRLSAARSRSICARRCSSCRSRSTCWRSKRSAIDSRGRRSLPLLALRGLARAAIVVAIGPRVEGAGAYTGLIRARLRIDETIVPCRTHPGGA